MIEAVRGNSGAGSAESPARIGGRSQPGISTDDLLRHAKVAVADYLLPIGLSVAFLVSLFLVVERTGDLFSWEDRYAGSGSFLVESCSPQLSVGPDQWVCGGWFTPEGHSAVRGTMTASHGAFTSDRPYVGERLDVFHATGDASVVHPTSGRLNEVARTYLALFPLVLMLAGSAIWLAGWMLTRNHSADDFVARDAMRLPQRFTWQSRGVNWMLAAVAMVAINFVLITRLIGSAGLS